MEHGGLLRVGIREEATPSRLRPINPRRPDVPPGPLEPVMHQARIVRSGHLCCLMVFAVGLALLSSGCAHVGECNPSDSTVSCCLKENPGQYERCTAVAPPSPQSQPNWVLPGQIATAQPESKAVPIPELPTQEERNRWDRDICRPRYAKCMETGGRHDGRVWGESQCKACFAACMRYGYWPLRANEELCRGA